MVPPAVCAGIWKIAVKVKLARLPQVLPAILVGLIERSTLVTLKGTGVGVGVLPPVPAVLQADSVKKRRQMGRSAEQREPPLPGDHKRLCMGCCNIVFSPMAPGGGAKPTVIF